MKLNQQKVILIIIDTLRAQSLGLYGQKPSLTPNIDRLGKRGIVFNQAYATTTRTDPSVSAILSGKYPRTLGIINHGIRVRRKEISNLTKAMFVQGLLKKAGYKTMAVDWLGRWFKRGFDDYSGQIILRKSHGLEIWGNLFFRFGRILDLIFIKLLGRDFFLRGYYTFSPKNNPPYDPADKVVEKGIELIRQNTKEPFFLYLHFWDPHFPYIQFKTWSSFFKDSLKKRYLNEVQFVDHQLGKLFAYLKNSGLSQNTLIILTGDHGENVNEHGVVIAHRGLYETTVKVPLIFCHPLLPKKKIQGLVSHVDIVPTILEFINLKTSTSFDGQSLLPLIDGQKKEIRKTVFFEEAIPGEFKIRPNLRLRGLRSGQYKFIQTFTGPPEDVLNSQVDFNKLKLNKEELFNIIKDPQELNNLIKKEKQQACFLRESLKAQP